jgi:hypothetical protein
VSFKDAFDAIREAFKLAEDVKSTGIKLQEISTELRDHDRRITRLEAQWDTALAIAGKKRLE